MAKTCTTHAFPYRPASEFLQHGHELDEPGMAGVDDVPISNTFGPNTRVSFKVFTDAIAEPSGAEPSDQH